MPRQTSKNEPLLSHSGLALTRDVSFRFALDPTKEQERALFLHAGAARFAYNHHMARIRANLDQRSAERSYGIQEADLTPALSWSKFSLINEFNAWKNGKLPSSPVNDDGSRGLSWRNEVSGDVFESASVNAAQALANFTESRSGSRRGKKSGFPGFKARHKTTPSFRLRNRVMPGKSQQIRVSGAKMIRVPTLGDLRVHGSTRQVRRMLSNGRLHLYSASFRYERGRWWVSLAGLAAPFHHRRRSPSGRHPLPAGMDRGVKTLAVIADSEGQLLAEVEGVKPLTAALRRSDDRLRRAGQAHARTKPGSAGRRKAQKRLVRIHAKIYHQRRHALHLLSHWCATNLTQLTIEDLNVAGMMQLRSLARVVADASMSELGRQLTYKADWYGLNLTVADRWFPSSKLCSSCGTVRSDLTLSDRVYECDCLLTLDRDLNAAINLARWREPLKDHPPRTVAS